MPPKTSMFAGNNREEEMTCVESTLYSKVLSTESKDSSSTTSSLACKFFYVTYRDGLKVYLKA